ncbi:MAG TPA: sialidase family protein [Mycobacterium sp.]|nr:sialidase family protein [Mycobacterium sp.]
MLAGLLTAAFAAAVPAQAVQPGLVQISADPYTPANAPRGQHATEVEPDTFAWGSTMVSTFQVGRVFNGGATDIGFATSTNGGVSWTHGFLPGTSQEAMQPGPFFSASDASVAYDARDDVWIISWLGAHFSGGGIVDVMVSRSTDGGLTWGSPVTVAATNVFYDKNWSTCDNSSASPFYGHCYTEFDNASAGDLELMSTSADSGSNWGAPTPTADNAHGLGGQPVVQPNGRVVVPYEGLSGASGIRSFSSDDGGTTWNASVQISTRTAHNVPGVRTSPLPSAEINRTGTVYVVWQDRRFEPGGTANDIVLSTSPDGATWSPVSRIPIDPIGSNIDHFIPGLAVDRTTAGASTTLALTYYSEQPAGCTGLTCEIQAGFTASLDNGKTWSAPQKLGSPMQLGWIAPTTQGAMVGDYISTSFVAGQQRVLNAFPIGFAPTSDGLLDEPMFSAVVKLRTGTNHMRHDPVLVNTADTEPIAATTF